MAAIPSRLASALAVVLGTGLIGACAVGPDFKAPEAPAPAAYAPESHAGPAGVPEPLVHYVDAKDVPASWWQLYKAPELDAIVLEALRNSPTLAAAQARLRQSMDARRAGYGVFMPQVGISAGATRERTAPLQLGSTAGGSIFNVFTLSGSVGYVLDLFGGERRRVEVLGAQVDEARENARATYISLTANVVSAAIARAAYAEEAATTRDLIGASQIQLQLADDRYQAGNGAYADVAALRADLASLQATLPALALREEEATHLLSVLCGHLPDDWVAAEIPFDSYVAPADLPVTVPSTLVRQRPDIRAAEARLHQSSANIGVATADMFPSVNLSATMGRATNALSNLTPPQGRFWGAGGELTAPVFQGGTLWYTRRAAVEAYQASLQDYRSVVLQGFDQVADALRALEYDSEASADNGEAVRAATESMQLVQANYAAGVADYVAVLAAMRTARSARLAFVQSSAQRLQDVVALFVALGGDWSATSRAIVEGAP